MVPGDKVALIEGGFTRLTWLALWVEAVTLSATWRSPLKKRQSARVAAG